MREHLSPEMNMGRLTECVIDQLRDTGLRGGGVGPVYTSQPERGNFWFLKKKRGNFFFLFEANLKVGNLRCAVCRTYFNTILPMAVFRPRLGRTQKIFVMEFY